GSARGLGLEPPEHPDGLRRRRSRGNHLHRDGARGRKDPSRAPGVGAAAPDEEVSRRRRADRRRSRQGPCGRDRAPGSEARERDGLEGRLRQDSRLRAGETDRDRFAGRVRAADHDRGDRARHGHGHGRVHVARAGERPAPRLPLGWVLPAAAALAAGIAAGFLLRGLTANTRTGAPVELSQLTYARGSIMSARFAPDAQTVVYAAAWEGLPLDVFTTRPGSSESRSLGLAGAGLLAISSTGELALSLNRHFMFGFETAGTLARVPLAGGAPREVLENVEDADWSPDGKSLAVARHVGNRNRLDYPIGTVLYD